MIVGYKRHIVLVDDEDWDWVSGRTWYIDRGRNTDYVMTAFGSRSNRAFLRLHRYLTGWPLVDHVNGNGLDNRRANLRPATNAQNLQNRPGMPGTSSRFKGVSARKGKWRAVLKGWDIGSFASEEDAARAYDREARQLYGEYAWLNFPDR